jgi:hypothetical protein
MRINAMLTTHDLPAESLPWMEEVREIFDELVIFIDAKRVAPNAVERAEKVASRVHHHDAETWYEWDLGSMARACESEWVFIIERDEELSPEWRQPQWRQLLKSTDLTHFWIPRRWVVPGGRYISAAPWWPDSQLRLMRNNVSGTIFPTRLHDPIQLPGPGGHFSNLALHHHVLWMSSRSSREERVRYYERLRPGGALGHYYLYEDHAPPQAELPPPVKLDIDREIIRMDTLAGEKVAMIHIEVNRVPRQVNVSAMFWLDAKVTNNTDEMISAVPPYPVRLAYHWLEQATRKIVVFDSLRSALFPGLEANATRQYSMTILAPNQSGEYILQVTLVQDLVCWLEDVHPAIVQEFPISVRDSTGTQ